MFFCSFLDYFFFLSHFFHCSFFYCISFFALQPNAQHGPPLRKYAHQHPCDDPLPFHWYFDSRKAQFLETYLHYRSRDFSCCLLLHLHPCPGQGRQEKDLDRELDARRHRYRGNHLWGTWDEDLPGSDERPTPGRSDDSRLNVLLSQSPLRFSDADHYGSHQPVEKPLGQEVHFRHDPRAPLRRGHRVSSLKDVCWGGEESCCDLHPVHLGPVRVRQLREARAAHAGRKGVQSQDLRILFFSRFICRRAGLPSWYWWATLRPTPSLWTSSSSWDATTRWRTVMATPLFTGLPITITSVLLKYLIYCFWRFFL